MDSTYQQVVAQAGDISLNVLGIYSSQGPRVNPESIFPNVIYTDLVSSISFHPFMLALFSGNDNCLFFFRQDNTALPTPHPTTILYG